MMLVLLLLLLNCYCSANDADDAAVLLTYTQLIYQQVLSINMALVAFTVM